ncbi:SixA phosphatase family protein [Sandaracinobacteroides sp. A072]|uniref:SixA phosphatase family protein n=1 Tax=Sandaracinobacteroides sp. A072 TaxID=3461146 RepID=UPI0040422B0A
MKLLSLLRHAKSSWDDPVERDYDRPLNGRGHRAARRMGQWLKDNGLVFDHVIASPALRIRQTIEGVEAGYGAKLAPQWDRRIYMASAATLFDLLRETPDDVGHLLLIGHNPGLEDLLLLSTRGEDTPLRREAEEKFPTASFATIALPVDHWAETDEGGARLERFIRPRDLDPGLGPES